MKTGDHDIRDLVKASAAGDANSYKKLYEYLVNKVYVYVQFRTNSRDAATDITQEVFIDLFSALPNFTYQSTGQFYSYLFTITKRKLARHYVDQKLRKSEEVEFDENSPTASVCISTNTEVDHDVATALDELENTAREIVVLHHWSRYTFGEIALLLNMKESAVRVRHHRALKLLATNLDV